MITVTLGMCGRKMLKLRNAMIVARWLILGASTVKPASIAMIPEKDKLATLWEKKYEQAPRHVFACGAFGRQILMSGVNPHKRERDGTSAAAQRTCKDRKGSYGYIALTLAHTLWIFILTEPQSDALVSVW